MNVTYVRRQVRFRFTAVKDRHRVPAVGQPAHDVRTDEFRAAKDKDPHNNSRSNYSGLYCRRASTATGLGRLQLPRQ